MRKILVVSTFVLAAAAAATLMFMSLGPRAVAQAPAEAERVPAAAPGKDVQQPIEFSHEKHAGEMGMDCLYCHVGADTGPVATIPAVSTCMGCHKMVKTTSPEIQKLKQYYDNQQPIPWVRIHDVPDHVRFDHHSHVEAGISCQTCHGPVETMARVSLQRDLTMGFCIDCHKQNLNDEQHATSLDCWTCHK